MRLSILAVLLATPALAAPPSHDTCVDVAVGTAASYACINQQLQQASQNSQRFSSDGSAPYNATSPSNVTGQFNEDATRNRLGTNFGKSVTPQRPVQTFAPAFAAPARPH